MYIGLQVHVSRIIVNDTYSRNALNLCNISKTSNKIVSETGYHMRFGTYRICAKASLQSPTYVTSGTRGLNFGPSLHLHPYFMYARSKDSGETAHMRRLV